MRKGNGKKILDRKQAVIDLIERLVAKGNGNGGKDIPQLIAQAKTAIQTELDKPPKVESNELGSYSD